MDQAIVELAKVLKEAQQKLGLCFDQLLDIVLDHEKRLQKFEKGVKGELLKIERFILELQDPAKKEAALAEFAALCNVLGIEDLEG